MILSKWFSKLLQNCKIWFLNLFNFQNVGYSPERSVSFHPIDLPVNKTFISSKTNFNRILSLIQVRYEVFVATEFHPKMLQYLPQMLEQFQGYGPGIYVLGPLLESSIKILMRPLLL